jgi:hypothetical protein
MSRFVGATFCAPSWRVRKTSTTLAVSSRRLVVESREGRDRVDRRTIRAALLDAGAIDRLDYEHMRPSEEPRLWLADAVA